MFCFTYSLYFKETCAILGNSSAYIRYKQNASGDFHCLGPNSVMWNGFHLKRLTAHIQKRRRVSATQCIPGTCTLTSCWQQGGVEEKMSVAEQKGTSEASDFMV